MLENSVMNKRGERTFGWNTLFFLKHQVNSVQPQLCILWNLIFSKSSKPNPMILCLQFYLEKACSFDIWKYWKCYENIENTKNVKPRFQPRYAYKLYTYKKSVYEMWKKVTDYCKNYFLRYFYQIYFQICPRFARIISSKPCFSSQK